MALGEELQKARKARKLTASEVAAGTRMKVQIVNALEQEDFDKIAAPIYAKGFIKLYAEYVGIDHRPLVQEYVSRYVSPPPEPIFDNELDYGEPEEDSKGRKFLFPRRKAEPESGEPVDSEIVGRKSSAGPAKGGGGDDLDLFSGVDVRPGDAFHTEREPIPDEFGGKLGEHGMLSWVTGLGRRILGGVAGLPDRIASVLKELEPGSPLRLISTAAIALIILFFLVSALSRCTGPLESDDTPPALVVEENLNIAVDPPDTYLD